MDLLYCTGASVAFIGSFYVWPRERRFVACGVHSLRTATRDKDIYVDRDSDGTIRRRSLSFLQNCVLSGAFLLAQASTLSSVDVAAASPAQSCLAPIGRAAGSTLLLFAGPLVDKALLRDFTVEESWLRRWRSYVICPIGEELFFRGVLFSLLRHRSSWMQIGVAAVLFALSHSHHIVSWACDEYLDRVDEALSSDDAHPDKTADEAANCDGACHDARVQRACWHAALRKLGFVYVYTGVFGALSGYYYLNVCEGSIGAIALVHALCNFIGPPEFSVLRSSFTPPLAKVVSAVAYVGGIAGWGWMLLHGHQKC